MLRSSTVQRKLDAKFKIGGLDATDLLAVMVVAGAMSIIFGQVPFGAVFIFGVPAFLFVALYFGKRGRPDGFLIQLLKFYITPDKLHAGEKDEI